MKHILRVAAGLALAFGAAQAAHAGTSLVGPIQPYSAVSHQWLTSLSATGAFTSTQPAVGDLATIGGGTVVGNTGTGSAAPAATTAPVLGIPGTSSGTIGIAGSSAGTLTLAAPASITSYTLTLPGAAPASSGQALTATTGGTASWSTVLAAKYTVTSKTANYTVASADDATRFDNSGAGAQVNFTLPASPSAGDEWCFLVVAAQTLEVLANTGETITVGTTTSSSAGNVQSNNVGSSVCIYFETATAAYAQTMTGAWTVN
jgi:hypothetical protein